MEHRKSLGYFITKYAIIELLYSLFIVILFYVCLHALINHEIIYPANYAEQQINTVQERFLQDQFNLSDIPYYYDYQYSIDGMVIESTFNNHLKQQMDHVFKKGYSGSTSFIGGTRFVPINKGNEELILAYHICSIPTNPNTYQYIHNFDLFYIICMFALWLIGFSILVHHSIKIIKKELTKIITVNSYIEDMNLDYKQVDSKFIEIHNVLDSLNTLSTNLRESLLKQWNIQQDEKELIESITHDIRTPITLIKGNLELLKEELPESSSRVQDINHGVIRLEEYISTLRNYSIKNELVSLNQMILDDWILELNTLVTSNNRTLHISNKVIEPIMIDPQLIKRALMNVVINAIEHSKIHSTITLDFNKTDTNYLITITNEGEGFKEDLLQQVTNKYITTKDNQDKSHGLGLFITNQILEKHHANLFITNIPHGAKVQFIFPLSNITT